MTVEIEAPASGTLAHLSASAGDEIPVGEIIAWIFASGEAIPAQMNTRAAKSTPVPLSKTYETIPVTASPVAARIAAQHNIDLSRIETGGNRITKADVEAYLNLNLNLQNSQTDTTNGGRIPASPKARRLAHENGIDLATISGTGPNGAVLTADVLAAESKPVEIPAPAQAAPMSRAWRVMAERLAESWRTVPHFYLQREVDATRLIEWRTAIMKRAAVKITYTDLLVKLIAESLRQHPRVNAMWMNEGIVYNEQINIGLAVAIEDGLIVPVIHDADRLTLEELALRRDDIVTRAQNAKLLPGDIQGGTFTISNLGMYKIDSFNAIVNPPQAAILAVGRIAEKIVPLDGQPVIRPMMMLNLSCDHRVVDGARGAQFLGTLAEFIEEPLGLIK